MKATWLGPHADQARILIEEMTPSAVLDLDDPGVGVELQFPDQAFLDLGLRCGLFGKTPAEEPIGRTRVLENALRRRAEQLGGAIELIELDENGARLLGSAPANGREGSLGVAAPDIGCDPDCRLQAHSGSRGHAPPSAGLQYRPRARPRRDHALHFPSAIAGAHALART